MVAAGYLLCSTNLRIKDNSPYKSSLLGLPNGPPSRGRLNPQILRERAELVFKLVPKRMTNLVIVNSAISEFDMIQAGVEVAEKYADNVMVIPPLLARMTYAIESIANFRDPPDGEKILVVTITTPFVDFVILRRDRNGELYVAEVEIYKPYQCTEMFAEWSNYYCPDATVFLVEKNLSYVADKLKDEFRPAVCFVRPYEKWDYVLLFGGMLRAINYDEGFDQRYQIANFSSGYETLVSNRGDRREQRHVLLPDRSPLPCNIYGYDGEPQRIKIYYFEQYYQVSNEILLRTREATKMPIQASGSSRQIIGYVDERGVPYAPPPKNIVECVRSEPSPVSSKRFPIKEERVASSNRVNHFQVEANPCVLFIDLATGSMLEYDPRTRYTLMEEEAFDPNLPSSSSSNPYQKLYDVLIEKSFVALHIINTLEILSEGKDLFHSLCNNVTYIPHLKAQLSYCFKKLKNEEHIEKFAIIFVAENRLMDLCIFEYRSRQYFFIQRVQDLIDEDVEKKIKAEYVKDAFIFCPKGVQLLLDLPSNQVTMHVFEVRDYENMALNGAYDMEENLKDLAYTKDLKALFASPESVGRTTRSASDAGIFSQTSSPISDLVPNRCVLPPRILFLFRDNYYAVEVFQNGQTQVLKDSSGNQWFPMYLSMADGKPVIGEKAKDDYQRYPKRVIYDVLKIAGKPLKEIEIDPKWGFKLTEDKDAVYFQVETPSGDCLIPQEIAISAFLKAMKLSAESFMDTSIKEIRLSTNFDLSESQKAVFMKAAALKDTVKIVSFDVYVSQ